MSRSGGSRGPLLDPANEVPNVAMPCLDGCCTGMTDPFWFCVWVFKVFFLLFMLLLIMLAFIFPLPTAPVTDYCSGEQCALNTENINTLYDIKCNQSVCEENSGNISLLYNITDEQCPISICDFLNSSVNVLQTEINNIENANCSCIPDDLCSATTCEQLNETILEILRTDKILATAGVNITDDGMGNIVPYVVNISAGETFVKIPYGSPLYQTDILNVGYQFTIQTDGFYFIMWSGSLDVVGGASREVRLCIMLNDVQPLQESTVVFEQVGNIYVFVAVNVLHPLTVNDTVSFYVANWKDDKDIAIASFYSSIFYVSEAPGVSAYLNSAKLVSEKQSNNIYFHSTSIYKPAAVLDMPVNYRTLIIVSAVTTVVVLCLLMCGGVLLMSLIRGGAVVDMKRAFRKYQKKFLEKHHGHDGHATGTQEVSIVTSSDIGESGPLSSEERKPLIQQQQNKTE